MFKTLFEDRPIIERKYHDPDEPFNPYDRFNYNGYECDPNTGLTNDEIKANLKKMTEEMSDLPHPVAKAYAVKYVLENTRIDINQSDYFITLYSCNRIAMNFTLDKWKRERFGKYPK